MLMFIGSTIACHAPHEGMAQVVVDTVAYGLHGFGAAPLVKLLADVIGFEV
jgi:hypothetical protein